MAGKPFGVDRFRRELTKSIEGLGIGFHDPTDWISTGSFVLNELISGHFDKGVPLGKVTIFAGRPASGKSLIVSGNIIKNAQAQNIFVIMIDTENALDEDWLKKLDVDTSEGKLLKLSMSMIDDVAKTISTFMTDYKATSEEDRPKILFVVDSLGMLMTPTDVKQFESGDMKGDMGRKAKALKALVTNCVNMFGAYNVGMVCTNHTYPSQDPYSPDDIVSGGNGFLFASSIVVATKPLKLKEDAEGNKVPDVLGIRVGCKVMKTRYNKPFETCEIKIPWVGGLDPYSGLFELFEKKNLIEKEGNRYKYIDLQGDEHKYYRKEYLVNTDSILDLIMGEYAEKKKLLSPTQEDIVGIDESVIEESEPTDDE